MRRINATDYYLFDSAYFEEIAKALGSRLHLFVAMAPDGEIAAAASSPRPTAFCSTT